MSPTANKDIAGLLLVSSLDAKVATGERATDFTERCCFKLSVLETDAFADKSMVDWTIEAILVVRAECAYLSADFRSSCPPFQKQHLENRRSFSSRVFLYLAFFKFLGDRRFEIFFLSPFLSPSVSIISLCFAKEESRRRAIFMTP